MPTVPDVWLTPAIVQLAAPLPFVVPEQLCCALPEPNVKVSVWPARSVPGIGSLVVSTPERVVVPPFVTEVVPVYATVVGASVTVNVLTPLVGSSWGCWLVSLGTTRSSSTSRLARWG